MKENSDPLDALIERCENAVNSGYWTLTKFHILNAKDELKKLRSKIIELNQELFKTNQALVNEINRNLDFKVVCWARINSRGDLYDPRLIYNCYVNEDTILPLYTDMTEYKEKYGKLSK